MWLLARYDPVGVFSLRESTATTSGGRSLLLPSPYAIKMAVLDIAWRLHGKEKAREIFELLKLMPVRIKGPGQIVLSNTFVKVARQTRSDRRLEGEAAKGRYPFERTVAFRQFAYWRGELALAFNIESLTVLNQQLLLNLLRYITYFGKRGSFVQFRGHDFYQEDDLPQGFGRVIKEGVDFLYPNFIIQQHDDMSPRLKFEQVDITTPAGIRLGQDRVLLPTLFPYSVVRTSRGYTYFELKLAHV